MKIFRNLPHAICFVNTCSMLINKITSSSFKFDRRVINHVCKFCKKYQSSDTRLQHVGTMLPESEGQGSYAVGQTFLHKVFAYRGVIIHPWDANISEQSKYQQASGSFPDNTSGSDANKNKAIKSETYYQVLMDSRDLPYNRDEAFFVTTIKVDPSQTSETMTGIQTVPGVDYVAHQDVLPYSSAEAVPIHNDLFKIFFVQDEESKQFNSTERLNSWKNNNYKSLRMDKVYKETTGEIRVTAIPFFLGMKNGSGQSHLQEYWWRYSIRVENLGDKAARLQERHWRIISNGSVKTVRGRGVTGKEPILNKENPVFQYCSHMSLPSTSGTMWGTFRFERENGEQFDARIPAFALETSSPIFNQ